MHILLLGSMKIFFQNIETEEKTVDGEVLGELDQVSIFFLSHLHFNSEFQSEFFKEYLTILFFKSHFCSENITWHFYDKILVRIPNKIPCRISATILIRISIRIPIRISATILIWISIRIPSRISTKKLNRISQLWSQHRSQVIHIIISNLFWFYSSFCISDYEIWNQHISDFKHPILHT